MEFDQIPADNNICEHYVINFINHLGISNSYPICIGSDDYTDEIRMGILKIFKILITQHGFVPSENENQCNAFNTIKNDLFSIWFEDGAGLFHVHEDDELVAVTKNVEDIIRVISGNIGEVYYRYYNISGHTVEIGNATQEVISNYNTMIQHGFIGHDDRLVNIQHCCEFLYDGGYGFYNLVGGFENDSEYDIITSDFNTILWYMNYEYGMYKEFD